MAREKRATWWKMLYHQRAAISSVSDTDAGLGLKAAFAYFDGEDIDPANLTPGAFTVFCGIIAKFFPSVFPFFALLYVIILIISFSLIIFSLKMK